MATATVYFIGSANALRYFFQIHASVGITRHGCALDVFFATIMANHAIYVLGISKIKAVAGHSKTYMACGTRLLIAVGADAKVVDHVLFANFGYSLTLHISHTLPVPMAAMDNLFVRCVMAA